MNKGPFNLKGILELFGKVGKETRETFRSLSNRNFRIYVIGQIVSLSGTWMQSVALSWLVYTMTGSATALGLVSFAGSVPLLILPYLGGILADKFNRRRILYVTQSLAMLQAIGLSVLVFFDLLTLPVVIGLSLFAGCVTAMELPSRQSFVPDLVDEADRSNAIGLNSAFFNVARMAGPALAGVVLASYGEVVCFVLNACSFVAAFIALTMIKTKPQSNSRSKNSAKSGSFKAVAGNPTVRNVLMLSAVASMFGFQYAILLPVVVAKVLMGKAALFGYLSAAGGIGALFGSLLVASRGTPQMLRRGIGLAACGLGCAIMVLAMSPSVMLSAVAIIAAGFCLSFQFSGGNSLVQSSVDPAARGRVMGIYSMFQLGFSPFAAILAGWFAEHYGVSAALLVSGALALVGAIAYLVLNRKREDEEGNK